MKQNERQHTGTSSSRRQFLKVAGAGVSFGVVLGATGVKVFSATASDSLREKAVGAWVRIGTDNSILIFNPSAEMGQGSMTALPVIVAEEMDADWATVRIEHSPIEPDTYGISWGRGGRGNMMTVGSRAVSGYFNKLRLAGAQIRQVLLQNAAREWQVPAGELHTEPSMVVHAASNRRISYGEIAAFAEVPASLPEVDESQLKAPKDFRIIGHSVPRHDIPAKTDGSAQFALDVHVPGMLYGMITRSPVHGGRPESYNEAAIRALPGITATVALDHGIGIIGETVEAVLKARDALTVQWSNDAPAETFDSTASLTAYSDIPGGDEVQARPIDQKGDAASALEQATKRYQADYLADHVYHAQMEPLNAVVSVNEAGDGAEVWVGTQSTSGAKAAVAQALGVPFDNITLHPCYLGGGLGRRSNSDYVVEAVHLSNAIKKPVKLIWTREDDLQYGQFRPMCLQRLEAGVDTQGELTAWTHCVVGDGGGLLSSGIRIPFYDIPNQHIEMCSVRHGMRLKHWRAVGHGFNKFAIEAFIDEIAADQGVDPYQMRRTLLRRSPRALHVLDTVAEMADWGGNKPTGRAHGIAFGERSGSLAAGVAEISVDTDTGKIRVHRFWCAIDAGIVVQPQNAEAQSEGSIINGLSSVLFERISVKDGKVEQSNFHDYQMLRMSDMPEVITQFIESEEPPAGLGEASLPLVGGAVANAFAALTGKRLRHMPFTPERVLDALKG